MPAASVRATRHGPAPSLGGGERGLGGLVVNGLAGFRGPGRPNDPPSRRLAPGGFYCVSARNPGSRGAGPCRGAGVVVNADWAGWW